MSLENNLFAMNAYKESITADQRYEKQAGSTALLEEMIPMRFLWAQPTKSILKCTKKLLGHYDIFKQPLQGL